MRLALSERFWIIASFFAIYFIWGSTYLANYLAIQAIPPFLMGGLRFFIAGLLVFIFHALLGTKMPSWVQWRNAILIGVVFIACGTGGVIWALQFVDTGLTSLMIAFQPLIIVLLLWGLQGKKPGFKTWLGVFLGITGMILLISQQSIIADQNSVKGIGVIGLSILAWGTAFIYVSRVELPASRFLGTAIQMLGGGLALILFGILVGELSNWRLERMGWREGIAFTYLVFLGSMLAFTAFNYLLQKVSADKVATSNYVNPIVALLLGWGFNEEIITQQSMLAALILLLGVFFINARS